MRIAMFTNTYSPHVGGVARSVKDFSERFRALGHRVLVVAPEYDSTSRDEPDVFRVPALHHFRGSDFSAPLPVPSHLYATLKEFNPQVVHSHHPFLLGDTALRVGAAYDLPVVFTHHTSYEQYAHYARASTPRFRRFVIEMVNGYCNLCDAVIAPSASVAELLRSRGIHVPVETISTGIDPAFFGSADGGRFRRQQGLPEEAFVVGHIGRLAPEKNLIFLARAAAAFLAEDPRACFLVAGEGPARADIQAIFARHRLENRLVLLGHLSRSELADAYAAMDVFAFSSQSETQGLVVVEAMAAGTPVVALDAPGVREAVRDLHNGRLLPTEEVSAFAEALLWLRRLDGGQRQQICRAAKETAEDFAMPRQAGRALDLYARLLCEKPNRPPINGSLWQTAQRLLGEDWNLLRNMAHAAGELFRPPGRM